MMNVCGNYICNCASGKVELDVYVCGPIKGNKKALFKDDLPCKIGYWYVSEVLKCSFPLE